MALRPLRPPQRLLLALYVVDVLDHVLQRPLLPWLLPWLLLSALVASADPVPITVTTGYVGRRLSNVAGRFHTVVERFEQCPGPAGGVGAVVVNVTRVSREWGPRPQPQRITGNIALLHGLDDSTATLLTIDKWSNNEWKHNAFVMRLPALCSALRGLGGLAGECPAKKGVYPVQDMPVDWRFPSMPEFFYGTWRAQAVFERGGARRGCVRVLFKTTPAFPEDWPDEVELDLVL